MKLRWRDALLALPLLLSVISPTRAQQPAESALLKLWRACEQNATNHLAAARACAQFDQLAEAAPFRPVGRGLMAWHLHRAGRPLEASKAWESMLTREPEGLPAAGNEMALRWLTRIDRERVREALEAHYRRHLEYPAALDALDALPEAQRPPAADRWGRAWDYRRESLKYIKGLMGQKFLLQSGRLGAASDLRDALTAPYAAALELTLEPRDAASPVHTVRTAGGERVPLLPGQARQGLLLAHAGATLIILTDGDAWRVLPGKTGP